MDYTLSYLQDEDEEDERKRAAISALATHAAKARLAPPMQPMRPERQLDQRLQLEPDREQLRLSPEPERPSPAAADDDIPFGPGTEMTIREDRDPKPAAVVAVEPDPEPEVPDLDEPEPEAPAPSERMALRAPTSPGPLAALARKAEETGVAPRRRDDGPTLPPQDDEPGISPWAVIADVVTNTAMGRKSGIGDIVNVAGQQRQAWKKDQVSRASQEIENKFKQEQYRNQATNSRLREEELGFERETNRQKQDRLLHPENYPESREEALHRQEFEDRKGDRALDNARLKGEAEARNDERTYQHSRDSDQLSLQRDRLTVDERLRGDAIDQRREAAGIAGADRSERAVVRAGEIDEKQRIAKEGRDAAFMTKFATSTKGAGKNLNTLRQLDAILGRYEGGNVPGLDASLALGDGANDAVNALSRGWKKMTGKYTPEVQQQEEDADNIRKLSVELGQSTLRDETGAAAALNEQQRTAIRLGMGATATQAQRIAAIKIAREANQSVMRRFGAANPAAARQVLETDGLDSSYIVDPAEQRAKREKRTGTMGGKAKWSSYAGGSE